MKTLTALYLVSILYLSSCIGGDYTFVNDSNFKTTSNDFSFIQNYKVTSPANLKISTSGGNIATTGYSADSIIVAFVVTKRDKVLDITLEELKKIADVEIIFNNNSLEINVKKTYEKNLGVGFRIKTPNKTSCNLNTSGGNIYLTDLVGTQNINTSGGNIDMEKLAGQVKASTSGGNVSINNSSANFDASTSGGNIQLGNLAGKLNVSTSGGNIDADGIKLGLAASTSGGNIDIKNVQNGVDVNTSGGNISLNEVSGSIKAITSGGDINADISKLSEKLILETSGGSIHATIPDKLGLDLDISADEIDMKLSNFTGSAKKDRIKGQMNGGGLPVQMSTSGGNISVQYK
jgi:hypothetical protein